jgi:hypothetical protein
LDKKFKDLFHNLVISPKPSRMIKFYSAHLKISLFLLLLLPGLGSAGQTYTALFSQPYRDSISSGDNNVIILLVTVNNSIPGIVTDISFTTSGSTDAADIRAARMWYTASPSFSMTTSFGSDFVSPNGQFSFSGSQALSSSGTAYFWLVYDIASSAKVDNFVKASCLSLKISGTTIAPSQSGTIQGRRVEDRWMRIYGDLTSYYEAANLVLTSGGGFAFSSFTQNPDRAIITKANKYGEVLWSKSYDDGYTSVTGMSPTQDGGFVMHARAGCTTFNVKSCIVKVNSSGALQWTKGFNFDSKCASVFVIPTSEGGYMVASTTDEPGHGSAASYRPDLILIKLNSSGNVSWSRVITHPVEQYPHSIIETSDGGFVCSSWTFPDNVTAGRIYITKIDASGNLLWGRKIYQYDSYLPGLSIKETSDGGLIGCSPVVPYYNTGGGGNRMSTLAVKMDGAGNVQWMNTYNSDADNGGEDICETSDGYIIYGSTNSFRPAGSNPGIPFMMKIGPAGEVIWTRIYDMPHGYNYRVNSPGHYVWQTHYVKPTGNGFLAYNKTTGNNHQGYLIVMRTDDTGRLFGSCHRSVTMTSTPVSLASVDYPAISSPAVTVSSRNPSETPHFIPTSYVCNDLVVPVRFLNARAYSSGNQISISWKALSDLSRGDFVVERSSDGEMFSEIGSIKVSAEPGKEYTFEDKSPVKGRNFYRLKLADMDREIARSNIASAVFGETGQVFVSLPNPVISGRAVMHYKLPEHSQGILEIYSLAGARVLSLQVSRGEGSIALPLEAVPDGMYLATFNVGGEPVHQQKICVMKNAD